MKMVYFILALTVMSCQSKQPPPTVEEVTPPYQPVYSDSFLMGHFDPSSHPDFVVIADEFANRSGMYMQQKAYEAFLKMHAAAQEAGISLQIISATRNFNYQKRIWERKWNGQTLLEGKTDARTIEDPAERAKEILRYSSMPGTSRHHWGTDVDFNSLSNEYFSHGKGLKEFNWLNQNAAAFGFCRSYTEKGPSTRQSGYEEEKWHWSYTPLSHVMIKDAEILLKNEMVQGFAGSETANALDVIKNYVLGVDQCCFAKN